MRCLIKRLEALEVVHAEKSRPAPIGVAYCPFLPGEPYAVDLPAGRKEFDTQEELFNFMDERGLIGDGLLMVPGLRSEDDWLAAVAQEA